MDFGSWEPEGTQGNKENLREFRDKHGSGGAFENSDSVAKREPQKPILQGLKLLDRVRSVHFPLTSPGISC